MLGANALNLTKVIFYQNHIRTFKKVRKKVNRNFKKSSQKSSKLQMKKKKINEFIK